MKEGTPAQRLQEQLDRTFAGEPKELMQLLTIPLKDIEKDVRFRGPYLGMLIVGVDEDSHVDRVILLASANNAEEYNRSIKPFRQIYQHRLYERDTK